MCNPTAALQGTVITGCLQVIKDDQNIITTQPLRKEGLFTCLDLVRESTLKGGQSTDMNSLTV